MCSAQSGSRLNELDSEALVRESTSILRSAPFLRSAAQVVYEGENASPSVIGTRLDYFVIRNWKVLRGDLWPSTAESLGDQVVVLGSQTARDLFGAADPVGHTVGIGQHPYTVLGVLEEKGQSPFGQSQDEVVLMPITTMRSHLLITKPHDTHALLFSATAAETTERAKRPGGADPAAAAPHRRGRRGRLHRPQPGRVPGHAGRHLRRRCR